MAALESPPHAQKSETGSKPVAWPPSAARKALITSASDAGDKLCLRRSAGALSVGVSDPRPSAVAARAACIAGCGTPFLEGLAKAAFADMAVARDSSALANANASGTLRALRELAELAAAEAAVSRCPASKAAAYSGVHT